MLRSVLRHDDPTYSFRQPFSLSGHIHCSPRIRIIGNRNFTEYSYHELENFFREVNKYNPKTVTLHCRPRYRVLFHCFKTAVWVQEFLPTGTIIIINYTNKLNVTCSIANNARNIYMYKHLTFQSPVVALMQHVLRETMHFSHGVFTSVLYMILRVNTISQNNTGWCM
jgi:hypothetical protein